MSADQNLADDANHGGQAGFPNDAALCDPERRKLAADRSVASEGVEQAATMRKSVQGNAEMVVPNYIDVRAAQRTRVVHFPKLLQASDLEQVVAYHRTALLSGDPMDTNPQNQQHYCKTCTFLHGPAAPNGGLIGVAPRVLAKLIRAAVNAKEIGCWGKKGEEDSQGVLDGIDVRTLSIRVVELWDYQPGGGLVDDYHYDAGSIVTIVCLANGSGEFTGGVFRTFEPDGAHVEHHLEQGDAVCFVSHKYHNITPVITGRRRTLVIELWQGGLPMWCR